MPRRVGWRMMSPGMRVGMVVQMTEGTTGGMWGAGRPPSLSTMRVQVR